MQTWDWDTSPLENVLFCYLKIEFCQLCRGEKLIINKVHQRLSQNFFYRIAVCSKEAQKSNNQSKQWCWERDTAVVLGERHAHFGVGRRELISTGTLQCRESPFSRNKTGARSSCAKLKERTLLLFGTSRRKNGPRFQSVLSATVNKLSCPQCHQACDSYRRRPHGFWHCTGKMVKVGSTQRRFPCLRCWTLALAGSLKAVWHEFDWGCSVTVRHFSVTMDFCFNGAVTCQTRANSDLRSTDPLPISHTSSRPWFTCAWHMN